MRDSRLSEFLRNLWFPAFLLSLVLAAQLALQLGFFVDETVDNSAAAYNFFRSGIYTSIRFAKPFDVEITSGLPLTWISGLVWLAKGNLFLQRVLLLVWHLMLFFGLARLFQSRAERDGRVLVIQILAVLWMAFLFIVPNWQTLLQNLAEVEGAILFVAGALLWRQRPVMAGVMLGLAVWGCKIIILPGALLLMFFVPLVTSWQEKEPLRATSVVCSKLFAGFLLPLLAWMLYIGLRTNIETAFYWPFRLFYFVTHQGGAGLGQQHLSLAQRLVSPELEWVSFGSGMKLRILLILAAPLVLLPAVVLSQRMREAVRELSRDFGWSLGSLQGFFVLFNAVYGFWWFFLHPVMIYRHVQFALVTSLLFSCAFLYYWLRRIPARKWLMVGVGLFSCVYFTKLNFQYWGQTTRPFYSLQCSRSLFTRVCLTETYWNLVAPDERDQ